MKNIVIRELLRNQLPKLQPGISIRIGGAHEHDRKIIKVPAAFVLNTSPVNRKGEHWVCMYITTDRRGYFFDSFGRSPTHPSLNKACWEKLLRDNTYRWTWNRKCVQPPGSKNCGLYVCRVLRGLAAGERFQDIIKTLNEKTITI